MRHKFIEINCITIQEKVGGCAMITGIHHVSLRVHNEKEYDRVKNFYGNVLELSVVKEWNECILFDTGSGFIEVFKNGNDSPNHGAIRHFAFKTEDVDSLAEAVKNAGYEIFIEPKDVLVGGDSDFPARTAFCKGPLGEDIEFFHQKW